MDDDNTSPDMLVPPSKEQHDAIRQIILAGLGDCVAKLVIIA